MAHKPEELPQKRSKKPCHRAIDALCTTSYVKIYFFQDGEKLPKDLDEVRVVHKDIREVRAPRQAKKKNESTVSIRFVSEV